MCGFATIRLGQRPLRSLQASTSSQGAGGEAAMRTSAAAEGNFLELYGGRSRSIHTRQPFIKRRQKINHVLTGTQDAAFERFWKKKSPIADDGVTGVRTMTTSVKKTFLPFKNQDGVEGFPKPAPFLPHIEEFTREEVMLHFVHPSG